MPRRGGRGKVNGRFGGGGGTEVKVQGVVLLYDY